MCVCVCLSVCGVCVRMQTEEDILLREELEKMEKEHDKFSLWYTLDRPKEEGWSP